MLALGAFSIGLWRFVDHALERSEMDSQKSLEIIGKLEDAVLSSLLLGDVPSGLVYSAFMGVVSYGNYNLLIAGLIANGDIIQRNWTLKLTSKGRQRAERAEAHSGHDPTAAA